MKIAGFDFSVVWAPELLETDCQGEISYRNQKIKLCTSLQDHVARAKSTLLHEIVEAAVNYSEIKMDHTDLTLLSTQLYAILVDNGLEKLEAGLPETSERLENGLRETQEVGSMQCVYCGKLLGRTVHHHVSSKGCLIVHPDDSEAKDKKVLDPTSYDHLKQTYDHRTDDGYLVLGQ